MLQQSNSWFAWKCSFNADFSLSLSTSCLVRLVQISKISLYILWLELKITDVIENKGLCVTVAVVTAVTWKPMKKWRNFNLIQMAGRTIASLPYFLVWTPESGFFLMGLLSFITIKGHVSYSPRKMYATKKNPKWSVNIEHQRIQFSRQRLHHCWLL